MKSSKNILSGGLFMLVCASGMAFSPQPAFALSTLQTQAVAVEEKECGCNCRKSGGGECSVSVTVSSGTCGAASGSTKCDDGTACTYKKTDCSDN